MNQSEASTVLAKCSAFDNRKPSAAAAQAWAEALDPKVTVKDAHQIVVEHYAASRDWIMPKDINDRAKEMRTLRVREETQTHGEFYPQGDLTPNEVNEWRQKAADVIGAGGTRVQAECAAWQHIGQTPPAIEPTKKYQVNTTRIGARK